MAGVSRERRSLMQGPAWTVQGRPLPYDVHAEETARQSRGISPQAEEEEEDFTICLGPIAVASRMLGLETFTVTTEVQEYGGRRLIIKKYDKSTVHTFTVVTLISVNFSYIIYIFVNELMHNPRNLFLVSHVVNIIIEIMSTLVALIGMRLNKKKRQEILKRFALVDKYILEIGGECYRKWLNTTKLILISGYAIVIITACMNQAVSKGLSYNPVNWFGYLRVFVTLTTVANYVNIVLLARQGFIRLNTILWETCNHDTTCEFQCSNAYTIIRLQSERLLNLEEIIHGTNSTPPNLANHTYLEKILDLRIYYDSLVRIVSLINSAFGVIILFSILSAFIHSIFCTFLGLSILNMPIDETVNFDTICRIAVHFMWSSINISEAVLIICVSSATMRAARSTGDVVQDLLLKPGLDKEERVQLKEFSDQISSNELVFTAAGLFTLDLPIIPSMAGSVMTYVLILMQLDPPQHK